MIRSLTLLLVCLLMLSDLSGQSCCSGGVPLSSNLGMPSAEQKTVQLNLSYDLNVLNTLKVGRERLNDRSRKRLTHSAILEWSYTIHPRLSVEGFFSFIRQVREITQVTGEDLSAAQGVGDAVLLLNYRLLQWQEGAGSWRVALGGKIPLGAHDRTNDRGLVFNAELQPGSGAWDGIIWSQWLQSLNFRPSMSLAATVAYSLKGKNIRYLENQTYQFGNEIQLALSWSDRFLLGQLLFDPSFSLRYRQVEPDRFNEGNLPATGGQWVFINPAMAVWLHPDVSWSIGISLPVFAEVIDTQFSPTYRINTGLFYRFRFDRRPSSTTATPIF